MLDSVVGAHISVTKVQDLRRDRRSMFMSLLVLMGMVVVSGRLQSCEVDGGAACKSVRRSGPERLCATVRVC